MNTYEIIFTTVNACLTLASVICAIVSVKQTKKQNNFIHQQVDAAYEQLEEACKQTKIAQKQLEESRKPDFPTTIRLESIARSIQQLDSTIGNGIKDYHNGLHNK